jgi:hypothetical protein
LLLGVTLLLKAGARNSNLRSHCFFSLLHLTFISFSIVVPFWRSIVP